MTVVATRSQLPTELFRARGDLPRQAGEQVLRVGDGSVGCSVEGSLDRPAGAPQRLGTRIDGESRLVAEEVTGHGHQHERHVRTDGGQQHGVPGGARQLDVVGQHHRSRAVRRVDGNLLGDITSRGAVQARGADQDQRLRREIDVLLVLRGVARHRPVTQLGQLDPQLLRRQPVAPVADRGPMSPRRGESLCDVGDPGA